MQAGTEHEFVVEYSGDVRVLRGERPPGKLIAYSRAFLLMNRRALQFYFVKGSRWQSVSLERTRVGARGAERAVVSISAAEFPSGITKREIQIITLIAAGLGNQQIADRFGTSPRTVSTQVERIMRKLGIRNRAGLAAIAVDGSLIALPIQGSVQDLVAVGAIAIEALAESLDHGTDPIVVGVPAQSSATRPIRIGTIAGLQGYSLGDAVEHLCGVDLAVQTINAAGGVLGRQLQSVTASADLSDAHTVRKAMGQLVDAGVDAIACSYVSAENRFLLDMAADFGRPFLHLDTYQKHAQLVTDDPFRYGIVFQTCPSEHTYSLAFTRFLRDLSAERAMERVDRVLGVVEMDVPSATVADEGVLAAAEAHGWDARLRRRVPVESVDWQQEVAGIIAAGISLLLVSHFSLDEVIALQRELVRTGYTGLTYHVYTASQPGFLQELGAHADGVIWSSSTTLTESAMSQRFRRDYALRYGTEPGPAQASAAFDQVQLLAWSWRQAGELDPEEAAKVLRSTMYRGLNGTYFFGGHTQTPLSYPEETNDPTLGLPLLTSQIHAGRSVVLSPDLFGSMKNCRLPW
ncbi:ABC transporter substrate-binding protein [Microbacterium sp. OR21]|uniref:ABC transporter substrate-binding protein n=1 Tax=Microbacterium sp. OR21 TaxID=3095346 RepID=UPI0039B52971